MSIILGIETSTKICSVAISDGEKLLALKEEGGDYSHSEKLTVFIKQTLLEANVEMKDLDAVAVSKGPGSYTGLRIGVSVAKGLCYALNKPLVAVDTLQAMAKNAASALGDSTALYCPMIDARRMEVYAALYSFENQILNPITAKIIDEDSFSKELKTSKIIFFGDGASKCQDVLGKNANASFFDSGMPSAEFINLIALEKLHREEFEDVAYFEPYYLKDFVGTTPKKLL